jgi:gliding motility-associated-like protein
MKIFTQQKGIESSRKSSSAPRSEKLSQRLRCVRIFLILMLAFLFTGFNEVSAQYSATLSANQKFIRPNQGTVDCGNSSYGVFDNTSAGSTQYVYATQSFYVSTAGNYTITVTSSTASDPMLFVYNESFNPNNPLTNFKVGDDDAVGSLLSQITGCDNYFGVGTYVIVVSTYSSSTTSGVVNFSVSGGGPILVLPTVSTNAASGIGSTSATLGGNVSADGGAPVTSRGVAYGTSSNPTSGLAMGSGTGAFSGTVTGLSMGTTYYARAYATNSVGTAYGPQISFSTISSVTPSVSTGSIVSIALNSASCNGSNVTSDGGASVSTRGIVYSTSSSPTLSNSVISSGSGTGTFNADMSSLSQSTRYYVRAYATNSVGTSYGSEQSFVTNHVVTYTSNGNGTVSPNNETIVNGGSGTPVTATPAANYHFLNWSDGSTVNPRTETNVTGSKTVSATFAINRLEFSVQPVNTRAGQPISFTVRIRDTYGNTMTNSDQSITVAIASNPSGGVLSGTLTVMSSGGLAIFSTPVITKTGIYTLSASATPLTATTSGSFTIIPAAIVDHFTVSGIADPVIAGTTVTPVVTAYDVYNNIKTDYTGTIVFSSAEAHIPSEVLPFYTFLISDNGTKTLINGVTLKTTGERSVTVTGDGKTGIQTAITVTPAALDHFILVTQHAGTETAGTPFSVTATAIDLFMNIKTDYTGPNSVNWTTTATSSPNGTARVFPVNGNQTFTAGVATIGGFTLFNSAQTPTITITDALSAKSGTTAAITVLNAPLDNFKVVAGTSQAGGVPFDVTVTARDIYWNTCIDYTGSIRFKSSDDSKVTFPAGLQSMAGYNGVKTYTSGVLINAIGAYWLRAADAVFAFKSGEQQNILIGPGAFSPLTGESTLTVDQTSRVAGEFVYVTITPRDAQGNLLYACRNISVFLDGVSSDYNGPIIVHNVGDGSYTASVRVTSTTALNVISAKLDNTPFDQTRTITVSPAIAGYLTIAGSAAQVAGSSQPITLTAYDAFNNLATGYTGNKLLTFSGANVSATPSTSPTVAGTAFGTGTTLSFVSGIATGSMFLYKVETASVSVTDGTINSTGHILSVVVSPALPAYLAITGTGIQVAGISQVITVTAYDAYNNVVTGYTGSVALTFSGANPALTTPTATNPTVAGTALGASTSLTFSAGVATGSMLLYKVETASISVTDGTINSADHKLTVAVTSAPAGYLVITGSGTQVAGESQTITITAYDSFNNVATGYTGSKSLTFSGANVSPTPSSGPTVSSTAFGISTAVMFTSGVATVDMVLYKVETALVTAVDGTINSNAHKLSVVVNHAVAGYLAITGTGTQVTGTSQTITVTAYDAFNNLATGYAGSVSLTFSGAGASPAPSISPIIEGIAFGSSTALNFVSGVTSGSMTLYKAETALITASDGTINSNLHKLSVVVSSGAAGYLIISGSGTQIAGTGQTVTVTAYDLYNNVAVGYTGIHSLTFTGANSSPAPVNNPTIAATVFGAPRTLTFTAGVSTGSMILYKTETALVTATDGSINADGHKLSVLVNPALFKDYLVYGVPSPHDLGTWVSVTVETRDTYNNRKTNYAGTVTFSNTDISAIDPADYQFTSADLGIHTFVNAILFSQPGSWWLTALDLNEPSKYGYQANIIVRRAITITANDRNKTYGDALTLGSAGFFVTGTLSPGESLTGVDLVSAGTLSDANAGIYDITTSNATGTGGFLAANYNITYSSAGKLTVNTASVTVTAQTDTKVYNRTTASTVAPMVTGILLTDAVGTAPSQSFDNWNVGTGKTLTASGLVINDGNGGANYSITYLTDATGVITTAPLTVTAQTDTKTYNGTTSSAVLPIVETLQTGDAVTLAGIETFDNKNVGTAKVLTPSGTVIGDGNGGANYAISYVTYLTGVITTAPLTVTAQTDTKVYDGTTSSVILPLVGSLQTGDASTLAGSQSFDTRNVGTAKVLTPSGTVINDGNGGANYAISYVTDLTGVITTAPLTVTAQTDTKVYDGTTGSVILPVVGTLQTGDVVSSAGSQSFDTRNVGTAKVLTPSGTVINDGNGGANYAISYASNLTGVITTAALNITAQTDTRIYNGSTSSVVLPVVGMLQTGDVITSVGSQTFDTRNVGTAKVLTPLGTVIGDGNGGANYAISYVTDLTGVVTTAPLTVTAQTDTKVYDGTTSSAVLPVVGTLQAGDGVTDTGTQTFNDQNTGTSKVLTPTGTIINDGNSGLNYAVTFVVNSTGEITPAALTVNADNKLKTYGDVNPALTISYSGFVNSEDASVITEPLISTTTVTGSDAGTYPITLSGGSAANYTLTLVNGVITVNKATLTVTADNKAKTYGGVNPLLTFVTIGFVGTDDQSVIDVAPSVTTTALQTSNAGAYDIIPAGGSDNNYAFIYINGTLTVNPAPLTATADNLSKIYGVTNPVLTITYTGLLNGDKPSGFTEPSISTTALTSSNTGTYPITLSGGTSLNYTLTLVNGIMTVNKATLTVTADNKVKTYGDFNPLLTLTYSGFKGTDDITVIDTALTVSTAAVQYSTPGIFSIVPAGGTDNNYKFTYINGTLTINKAILTFSADNKTRDYLASNPVLTFIITGFINGETQSVIDIMPTIQTAAVQNSNAGTYPITVAGGSDSCYIFIYRAGVMTISQIAQIITFIDVPAKMYVKDVYTVIASSTSGLQVQFESDNPEFATISGDQITGVARGTMHLHAYQPGDQNYLPAEIFADIEIISTHRDILHLFTPNNDGFNDTWEIPDIQSYGKCDVKVYNRWGQMVYANKNYDNLWDGTSNGKPLPDGAYYFIIKTENSGTITGTVNIVR